MTSKACRGLGWFRGDEFGQRGGRLHFHALLSGTEGLTSKTLATAWRDGWSLVEPYDVSLGAAYYLAKYVTKSLAGYDLGGRFRAAGEVPGGQYGLF